MSFKELVNDLIEAIRKTKDQRREQREKYRIEYAFTSGGRKYYRFADITNLPYQRGRAALTAYNELEMRCTRQFLLQFTKAMDDVLHAKEIDIFKINNLNSLLKDRLALKADMDICYRLAACVFFDKSEKPEIYEPEYAEQKIERWKKDQGAADFFLQKPLQELMPFLQNAVNDIDTYTTLNHELNLLHDDLMRINGSTDSRNSTTTTKLS